MRVSIGIAELDNREESCRCDTGPVAGGVRMSAVASSHHNVPIPPLMLSDGSAPRRLCAVVQGRAGQTKWSLYSRAKCCWEPH